MRRTFSAVLALFLAFGSSIAAADTTLGEILDKGAERLAGDEAKYMFTHSVSRGKTVRGALAELRYHADGTLTGFYGTAQIVDGTWRMDDKGRLCVTANVPDLRFRFKDSCKIWYKLDVYVYATTGTDSDTDEAPSRDAKVVQRLLDRPDSPAPSATRR